MRESFLGDLNVPEAPPVVPKVAVPAPGRRMNEWEVWRSNGFGTARWIGIITSGVILGNLVWAAMKWIVGLFLAASATSGR